MVVSVYIPTRNRAKLLCRAVASVLSQTTSDWECIIADDGSSDETPNVCKMLTKFDPRFRVIRNESSVGACTARNQAIEAARFPLVTGLDDDDSFFVQRLEKLLQHYDDNTSLVSANDIIVETRRNAFVTSRPTISTSQHILMRNSVGNQALMDKSRVLSVGSFDPTLWGSHDYDLWIKMILKFGPAKCLKSPLQIIYAGDGHTRITTSSDSKHAESARLIFEKYRASMNARQRFAHLGRIYTHERKRVSPLISALAFDFSIDSVLEMARALRASFRNR